MKKVATPGQSTTSSTTAKKKVTRKATRKKSTKRKTAKKKTTKKVRKKATTKKATSNQTVLLETNSQDEWPLFSPDQQELFLTVLSRGPSPAMVCEQLGLSVKSYLRTCDERPEFRHAQIRIQEVLSQNVAAMLYQTAMKGSVPAQSFWLKTLPPPTWETTTEEPVAPHPFDEYTNDELLTMARAMGVDVPAEFEAAIDPAGRP